MSNVSPAFRTDADGGSALANDDIGFRIKMISDALERSANRTFKEFGFTFSQMRLLVALIGNDGCTTQRQLELALGVTHPTVVGLVQRLEAKGCIKTHFSVEDARMKVVTVTERGREAIDRVERQRAEIEGTMVRGLSDEEIAELKCLLDRVVANLTGSHSTGA